MSHHGPGGVLAVAMAMAMTVLMRMIVLPVAARRRAAFYLHFRRPQLLFPTKTHPRSRLLRLIIISPSRYSGCLVLLAGCRSCLPRCPLWLFDSFHPFAWSARRCRCAHETAQLRFGLRPPFSRPAFDAQMHSLNDEALPLEPEPEVVLAGAARAGGTGQAEQ